MNRLYFSRVNSKNEREREGERDATLDKGKREFTLSLADISLLIFQYSSNRTVFRLIKITPRFIVISKYVSSVTSL